MYAVFIFTIGVENSYVIKRYTVALLNPYSDIKSLIKIPSVSLALAPTLVPKALALAITFV